jgi:hypothetical protein
MAFVMKPPNMSPLERELLVNVERIMTHDIQTLLVWGGRVIQVCIMASIGILVNIDQMLGAISDTITIDPIRLEACKLHLYSFYTGDGVGLYARIDSIKQRLQSEDVDISHFDWEDLSTQLYKASLEACLDAFKNMKAHLTRKRLVIEGFEAIIDGILATYSAGGTFPLKPQPGPDGAEVKSQTA